MSVSTTNGNNSVPNAGLNQPAPLRITAPQLHSLSMHKFTPGSVHTMSISNQPTPAAHHGDALIFSQRGGSTSQPLSALGMAEKILRKTDSGIQEHYDKASSVCGHIDDLVAALTELYDDNSKWKQKYIDTKKAHFTKFFGASTTILLGSSFREWKSLTTEMVALKKYGELKGMMDKNENEFLSRAEYLEALHEQNLKQQEDAHTKVVSELRAQVAEKDAKLEKLQFKLTEAQTKADTQKKVLKSLKGQLANLEDDDGEEKDGYFVFLDYRDGAYLIHSRSYFFIFTSCSIISRNRIRQNNYISSR